MAVVGDVWWLGLAGSLGSIAMANILKMIYTALLLVTLVVTTSVGYLIGRQDLDGWFNSHGAVRFERIIDVCPPDVKMVEVRR